MTDTAATPPPVPPAAPARGITCPHCGGRRWAAVYTRHRAGATVRVRQCRGCGRRIRTAERVESARP